MDAPLVLLGGSVYQAVGLGQLLFRPRNHAVEFVTALAVPAGPFVLALPEADRLFRGEVIVFGGMRTDRPSARKVSMLAGSVYMKSDPPGVRSVVTCRCIFTD